MRGKSSRILGAIAAAIWLGLPAGGQTASLTIIGALPDGSSPREAHAVSADGVVVVGFASSLDANQVFRWTESGGVEGLGDLAGGVVAATPFGISADGGVIVGAGTTGVGSEAFRWTRDLGMGGLGDFPGEEIASFAGAVSGNGEIVVGRGNGRAFRWTNAGGMVELDESPGTLTPWTARGVSADGSVVVGSGFSRGATEAYRWTAADGTVGLGHFPGTLKLGEALAVSADGRVVVGQCAASARGRNAAFRWSEADGLVSLFGPDPAGWSEATAASADGSVIVGWADGTFDPPGAHAFIWDAAKGMRKLADELENVHGVDLRGWELEKAFGISADGRVIVGTAHSPTEFTNSAFRVELSAPPEIEAVAFEFSGPLKIREGTFAQATFGGVELGEEFSGTLTVGATEAGSTLIPPAAYSFVGNQFFATLAGDGTTISTAESDRGMEVRYLDDVVLQPDELELLSSCLGVDIPAGTPIDLSEIETDLTVGPRRIEMVISFISLDLASFSGSSFRPFPSLGEVDLAVYSILEEVGDDEVYAALGVITEFRVMKVDPIVITEIARDGDVLKLVFESSPGVTGWQFKGDAEMEVGFRDDLTSLPGTLVTEEAANPGRYRATVNVAGRGERYFLRIER